MHNNVLIRCFQLSEKLQAGVQDILRDLFQQGSLSGLQVAGGPAEYYVRVRIEFGEKSVQAFSLRWWSLCHLIMLPGLWKSGPRRCNLLLEGWSNKDNRTT